MRRAYAFWASSAGGTGALPRGEGSSSTGKWRTAHPARRFVGKVGLLAVEKEPFVENAAAPSRIASSSEQDGMSPRSSRFSSCAYARRSSSRSPSPARMSEAAARTPSSLARARDAFGKRRDCQLNSCPSVASCSPPPRRHADARPARKRAPRMYLDYLRIWVQKRRSGRCQSAGLRCSRMPRNRGSPPESVRTVGNSRSTKVAAPSAPLSATTTSKATPAARSTARKASGEPFGVVV